VELIIPPNINDPLNLLSPVDKTEYELQLSGNLRKKRQRKRYKSGSEHYPRKKVAFAGKLGASPSQRDLAHAYDSNVSKESSDDEQADPSWDLIDKTAQKEAARSSPVMRKTSTSAEDTKVSDPSLSTETKPKEVDDDPFDEEGAKKKKKPVESAEQKPSFQKPAHCQYGNYNRYYGFESLNKNMDVRLKIFQRNIHLFKNKDVLDVGCNCGLMTLSIAKYFSPKTITGIDIDKKLIGIARSKLKKYVAVPNQLLETNLSTEAAKHRHKTECFPMSFPICYGNLSVAFKQIQKKMQTPQTLPSTPQTPQNEAQNLRIPDNISFEEVRVLTIYYLKHFSCFIN
jgi:7SK snRNA methylphosphate capping enzyme